MVLYPPREAPIQARPCDELADSRRAHVRRGVQKARYWLESVKPGMGPQPTDHRCPDDDLNFCSRFVQQGGRLQRALPTAEDQHLLSSEPTEFPVVGRVRHKGSRQARELRRTPGKRSDPGCDDHPP